MSLAPPNPRLQRTPSASPPSPLSRQPLGSRELPAAAWRGQDHVTARTRGVVVGGGEARLKSEAGGQDQLRFSLRLKPGGGGQLCALPNTALQPTASASPPPRLNAKPLGSTK